MIYALVGKPQPQNLAWNDEQAQRRVKVKVQDYLNAKWGIAYAINPTTTLLL